MKTRGKCLAFFVVGDYNLGMRTLVFLSLALCAAPVLAQNNKEKLGRESPIELNLQLKQFLQNFALELIITDIRSSSFGLTNTTPNKIWQGRTGYFGADEWVSEHSVVFTQSELTIASVKILKNADGNITAQINYSLEIRNDAGIEKALRQQWERPRQEIVQFKRATRQSTSGTGAHSENWKIVAPAIAPTPLPTRWEMLPSDNFWANITYHLSQKQLFQPSGTLAQRSLQNLKELGASTSLMTQDVDESYAFAPRYMIHALTPYNQSFTVFQIPDTNEIYSFNANLSGLKVEKVKIPTRTVLFYEGQNETPIFRYDGKAAICFTNGHVALVTPDEAKQLIWKP